MYLGSIKDHNTLNAGGYLASDAPTVGGQALSSAEIHNNIWTFIGVSSTDCFNSVMQADGNFVVYYLNGTRGGWKPSAKWSSGTPGRGIPPYRITLDYTGELILTDGHNTELWRAPHRCKITRQPCRLVMQDDGNLVLYDAANVPIWASDTAGQDHN